ncbi:hypothetical protein [uncultured Serinicoccus sp.]|uniref:hypothetical protein n=1 Tax=uncultured Serinicoccus sp. TaxID=735514 RepID=UPI00261399A0|nr:hypothetical protein [uncultured Serinicoccus sp.]
MRPKLSSRRGGAAGLVLLLVLGACGQGGEDVADENVVVVHSGDAEPAADVADLDVAAGGEYPLSLEERCTTDEAPGCPGDPTVLAGAGTTFVSDHLRITYRGGRTVRQLSGNEANPEFLGVAAVFDLEVVGDRALELTSFRGFDELRVDVFTTSGQGSGSLSECAYGWTAPTGVHGDPTFLEPGTRLTAIYCFASRGPESFLAGDPVLQISGDGAAVLTLRDADPDEAALDDVLASIEWVAEHQGAAADDTGLALFDRYWGELHASGEPLVTVDTRDADAEAAGAGAPVAGSEPQPEDGAVVPAPPAVGPEGAGLEEGFGEGSGPFGDEVWVGDDPGGQGSDGPAPGGGEDGVIAYDAWEAAWLLWEEELPAGGYLDLCEEEPTGEYACVEVVEETTAGALVGLRLGPTADPDERDTWATLTTDGQRWTIDERWDVGDGPPPDWVPATTGSG